MATESNRESFYRQINAIYGKTCVFKKAGYQTNIFLGMPYTYNNGSNGGSIVRAMAFYSKSLWFNVVIVNYRKATTL